MGSERAEGISTVNNAEFVMRIFRLKLHVSTVFPHQWNSTKRLKERDADVLICIALYMHYFLCVTVRMQSLVLSMLGFWKRKFQMKTKTFKTDSVYGRSSYF